MTELEQLEDKVKRLNKKWERAFDEQDYSLAKNIMAELKEIDQRATVLRRGRPQRKPIRGY